MFMCIYVFKTRSNIDTWTVRLYVTTSMKLTDLTKITRNLSFTKFGKLNQQQQSYELNETRIPRNLSD